MGAQPAAGVVMAADEELMRLGLVAVQAFSTGDVETARRTARTLAERNPDDANANQILGVLALRDGDAVSARMHLERANAAVPDQAQLLNTLGVATRACGDAAAARAVFMRAGELGATDAWRNLGNLELAEGDTNAALAAYVKAVELRPQDPQLQASLAQVYEQRHELYKAKAHAAAALQAAPTNETARIAMARVLLREGDLAGAEDMAAGAAAKGTPVNRAVALGLLGDAKDKRGDAAGAFAAFNAANQVLLQLNGAARDDVASPYHPNAVARLKAFAERADVSAWHAPADNAPAPVFLVGFPRSGTTLLDQILSSHPNIVCLEEKECLAPAVADLVVDERNLSADLADAEIITRRAAYRANVAAAMPNDGRRVVDKLPLNIVFLPLIRRLWPGAKVIVALRDPRDVVLSCFQQRFGMNAAMAQFLELRTAAAYYDAVMQLFEISRGRLGLDAHVVRYEDVVGDLENAARGLAAFLDAPFDPAMLRFRETALKRDIGTPSARQVIEPLYAHSVGRWRKYERELAPVLPGLTVWTERFGYAP